MTSPAREQDLVHGLLLSLDASDAVRAWASAAESESALVLLFDESGRPVGPGWVAEEGAWHPARLPLVGIAHPPASPTPRALSSERSEALEDLLYSLGLDETLYLPLDPPEAGFLVLARAGRRFASAEVLRLSAAASLLGKSVASHRRRAAGRHETSASPELIALLELARELASCEGPTAALDEARRCLDTLLEAPAGALVLGLGEREDALALAWPGGPAGERALAEARRALGEPRVSARYAGGASRAREPGRARLSAPGSLLVEAPAAHETAVALLFEGQPPASAQRLVGAVAASLGLARERFLAERERELRRLREALEGLPIGLALLDREGRVRIANRVTRERLTSLGSWPGIGHRLVRLGALDPLPESCLRASRGEPESVEIFDPEQGRNLVARFFAAGTASETSRRDLVFIIEDETERRRRGEQLAQAERLSALGVLISGIVHEINQPLQTILGYAQMLGATPHPAPKNEWIATLKEEARRCQRIVRDMLDVARPSDSRTRQIAMLGVCEKAIGLMAHPLRAAGIEAVVRGDPAAPHAETDPDAMLRVLLNLVTNAVHALEEHEGPRRLEVFVEPALDPAFVMVGVRDTGPGIAPELLGRIFDPFFTTKPAGKGNGLGLSLVASTVREQGGEIELESTPGQGCLFRVLLPAASSTSARAPREVSAAAVADRRLAGLRVLVADDEPAVAGLLSDLLGEAGAKCSVVFDGFAALQSMLGSPADVMICDVDLPKLKGPAIHEELLRRAPHLAQRVVFATGDAEFARSCERAPRGSRPVLLKPFDLERVLEIVLEVDVRASQQARRASPSSPPNPPGLGGRPPA